MHIIFYIYAFNIYGLLSLDTVIVFSFTQIYIIWQIIQAQ